MPHRELQLEPAPKARWFVTFGDLLTLLLCFFIAIISQTSNNPPDMSKNNQSERAVESSKQVLIDGPIEQPTGGTQFANLTLRGTAWRGLTAELETVLELRRTDFTELNQVSPEVLKQLDGLNNIGPSAGMTKRIEVCVSGVQQSSWQQAQQRAESLARQINDAGFGALASEIVVLGPYCERLQLPPQIGIEARVTFRKV